MKIITYPNPILENKSKEVEIPLKKEDIDLIVKMWQTVKDKGIGLAAPQVGVNKQICIIHLDPELADKKDKKLDFVMINPKIIFYSKIESEMVEGCLSFPEEYWQINRPSNIIVEYTTITNFLDLIKTPDIKPILKTTNLKAKNWMARVIQHEVDHLNGRLFINLGGKKLKTEDLKGRTVID
jgi:peptide deformylase